MPTNTSIRDDVVDVLHNETDHKYLGRKFRADLTKRGRIVFQVWHGQDSINSGIVGARLKANKLQALHVTDFFTLNETLEPPMAYALGNVH